MSRSVKFVSGIACTVLALVLGVGNAFASCGDSMNALAARAAAIQSHAVSGQQSSTAASSNANNASIVGMWHIRFVAGDQTIQEAFQIWNFGGTEVHNPNVDPRTGSVCLGTWKEAPGHTFKLSHRVWRYDASGNYQGIIRLSESVALTGNGDTHSGSFTLDFYDQDGNFQFSVPGNVVAERVTVD